MTPHRSFEIIIKHANLRLSMIHGNNTKRRPTSLSAPYRNKIIHFDDQYLHGQNVFYYKFLISTIIMNIVENT